MTELEPRNLGAPSQRITGLEPHNLKAVQAQRITGLEPHNLKAGWRFTTPEA
jgi:hypothetical protein